MICTYVEKVIWLYLLLFLIKFRKAYVLIKTCCEGYITQLYWVIYNFGYWIFLKLVEFDYVRFYQRVKYFHFFKYVEDHAWETMTYGFLLIGIRFKFMFFHHPYHISKYTNLLNCVLGGLRQVHIITRAYYY